MAWNLNRTDALHCGINIDGGGLEQFSPCWAWGMDLCGIKDVRVDF